MRGALAGIGGRLSGNPQDRPAGGASASRAWRARSCACRSPRGSATANWCARAPLCASPAIFRCRCRNSPPTFRRSIRKSCLTDGVANADEPPPAAEPDAEVSFVTCDFVAPGRQRQSDARRSATSIRCCRRSSRRRFCRSTTSSPACATLRARPPRTRRCWPTPTRARRRASNSTTPPRATPTPISASKRASFLRTLRFCPRPSGNSDWSEHLVIVKKGETVGSILRELGAAPDEIKDILAVLGARGREGGVKEGQKLRVLTAAAGLGHMQPLRVIIAGDSGDRSGGRRSPTPANTFRSISAMSTPTSPKADEDEASEDDGSGVRLYQSIYETALRNNVPNSGDRGADPHLFLRCRLPAQGAARRLVRRALCGRREQRRQERGALRFADGRRRDQEVLSLSDRRRRHVRLLRRDRKEREEVPGAQTGRHRHHALRASASAIIRCCTT